MFYRRLNKIFPELKEENEKNIILKNKIKLNKTFVLYLIINFYIHHSSFIF